MVNQSSRPAATNHRPAAPHHTSTRSPITLAFLFYLVTFGGIISACLGTLAGNEAVTRQSLQWSMIGGGAMGRVIGGFVGSLGFGRWCLAVAGTHSGLFVGLIAVGWTCISS